MPCERLKQRLSEYKATARSYPRQGYGLNVLLTICRSALPAKSAAYYVFMQPESPGCYYVVKMNVYFSDAEDVDSPWTNVQVQPSIS